MKKLLFILFLGNAAFAQSIVGHNNSGSLVTANYSSSVGEIYVVPQNPDRASSGTLAASTQIVLGSLGLQDYAETNGITYYPNPVQNYLTIDLQQQADLKKAQLFDVKGTQIKLPAPDGNMLNLSGLQAGTYFIVLPDTKLKPIKIVKN